MVIKARKVTLKKSLKPKNVWIVFQNTTWIWPLKDPHLNHFCPTGLKMLCIVTDCQKIHFIALYINNHAKDIVWYRFIGIDESGAFYPQFWFFLIIFILYQNFNLWPIFENKTVLCYHFGIIDFKKDKYVFLLKEHSAIEYIWTTYPLPCLLGPFIKGDIDFWDFSPPSPFVITFTK